MNYFFVFLLLKKTFKNQLKYFFPISTTFYVVKKPRKTIELFPRFSNVFSIVKRMTKNAFFMFLLFFIEFLIWWFIILHQWQRLIYQ